MRRSFAPFILLALGAAAAAAGALPLHAPSESHEPALPHDFGRLYATLDRADLGQYRELYAPASALAAIKHGKALPAGTVLTMILYSPKRDEAGRPLEDANGRYVKNEIAAYLVMRKLGGGARTSSAPAPGHWRFQQFRADGRIDRSAKSSDCAACHEKRRARDFVFTDDLMESFAPERAAR